MVCLKSLLCAICITWIRFSFGMEAFRPEQGAEVSLPSQSSTSSIDNAGRKIDCDSPVSIRIPRSARDGEIDAKSCCEVRVRCCKKVASFTSTTLKMGLLVTSILVVYGTFKLINVGNDLVSNTDRIGGVAENLLEVGKQGIVLAQQAIQGFQTTVPEVFGLLNKTRIACMQAGDTCLSIHKTCGSYLSKGGN